MSAFRAYFIQDGHSTSRLNTLSWLISDFYFHYPVLKQLKDTGCSIASSSSILQINSCTIMYLLAASSIDSPDWTLPPKPFHLPAPNPLFFMPRSTLPGWTTITKVSSLELNIGPVWEEAPTGHLRPKTQLKHSLWIVLLPHLLSVSHAYKPQRQQQPCLQDECRCVKVLTKSLLKKSPFKSRVLFRVNIIFLRVLIVIYDA